MEKDLTKIPGTIAYVLNQHINELSGLMNKPGTQELRKAVKDILMSSELDENRKAADEAVKILDNCKSDYLYLSTLTTYLTGQKIQ